MFAERYARRCGRLSPAFQRVAAYIDANPMDVLAFSAVDLARAIGTSDATVVRAVQALGFTGLADLRAELAGSWKGRNAPAENLNRTWSDVGESAQGAMDSVLDSVAAGLDLLRSGAIHDVMLEALRTLHVANRIVVFGVGPTAHIAAYFAARLRRKGRRQLVLDRTGAGLADQLLDLAKDDALLMLTYGKAYREAEVTIFEARRLHIPIVLITDSPQEKPARLATVVLPVPRGRSLHVALHATTLACLEMLLLGLATTGRDMSVTALGELDRLRRATRPARRLAQAEPDAGRELE